MSGVKGIPCLQLFVCGASLTAGDHNLVVAFKPAGLLALQQLNSE